MSIHHNGIGLWRDYLRAGKPLGLTVMVDFRDDVDSGVVGYRFDVDIPWEDLLPFKDEIQSGLHDDIAGALRERFIALIDKMRKEVEEA